MLAAQDVSARFEELRKRPGRPKGTKPGSLDKTQLELLLGRLLKSSETPIQYKAALASNLASLKAWNKTATDETNKTDIETKLRGWARECIYKAGASAATLAQAASAAPIDSPMPAGERSSIVGHPGGPEERPAGGGIPQAEAPTEALIPSYTTIADKKSDVSVDNKEVK